MKIAFNHIVLAFLFVLAIEGYANEVTLRDLNQVSCGVSEAEKQALLDLYNATNGANWKNTVENNKPWNEDIPVCDWYGITVNNGRLVSIWLDNNNLSGSIPATINQFTDLQTLNFNFNELFGEIPPELGSLVNLSILSLASNQLSGNIPSELGSLIKLKRLILQNNQLSGTLPNEIENLTKIEYLYIFNNQNIRGKVPSGIKNFTLFKSFRIQNNSFVFLDIEEDHNAIDAIIQSHNNTTGSQFVYSPQAKVDQSEVLSVAPGQSITLTSTALTSNNNSYQWYKTVNGVATAIAGATSKEFTISNVTNEDVGIYHFLATNSIVTGLTLERNPITLTVDSCGASEAEKQALIELYNATNGPNWTNNTNWLTNAPVCDWYGITVVDGKVEKLILENNNLTGVVPTDIDGLINLKQLFLQRNNLSGTIPSEIGNLINLEYLSLYSNDFSGEVPLKMGELINLENLYLYENNLSGAIPSEIGGAISLIDLRMYDNNLSEGIPSTIGNLVNLKRLFLHDNDLTGGIPSQIGNLINLEQLYLYENDLSGVIPSEIGGGVSLKELRLNDNNFTGAIPSEIGNLINLTHLVLDSNDFTGVIPSTIGNLINLTHLFAKENNLTGAMPSEIGNLIKLKSLMLNNNDFTGEIPSTIGNLINLNRLSIYENNLSGELPSTIGNLTSLQYLYSSNNNLIGTIPSEIANLSFLKYLDLGYNKLSGNISLTISSMNSLVQFIFGGNAFVFSDFESKHISYSQVVNYGYAPQAKVDLEETKNVAVGESITFTSTALTSNNNSYQWYKMVNGMATAISGATSKDFTISNATNADAGVYHFLATNDIVTGLTLERNPITLTLEEDSCGVSDIQKQALLDLYNATNGPNWKNTVENNKPWTANIPVCDWYGVTVSNGNVIKIDLNNNNLTGHLPATLSNLGSMEWLVLYRNKLTGSIPTELGGLSNLRSLSLGNNQLTGNIPMELGNLTNLSTLSLSTNQLSGSIPTELSNLTSLLTLDLVVNQLTGNIPEEFGGLSNLRNLSLSNNQLSGNIPTELGNLSNLRIMSLGGNQLSGNIPSSIGGLSLLQQLLLGSNVLEGEIPEELGDLSNLKTFWLNNNNLNGNIPSSFGNLMALQQLTLNDNELEGEIPTALENLSNLKVVWLSGNNFKGKFPSLLNSIGAFQQLRFHNNAFVFSDFELEHVAYSGISAYSYAPQAKVDDIETVSVGSGQSITLTSMALTSDNNNYQWYKRVNGTTTAIVNGTSKDLTIGNASEADAGEYYFLATNDIVTGLTLERNPITLMVDVIDNAFCLSALSVEYPVVGDLVPQGDNIEWYLEETGGVALVKDVFISPEAESPGGKVYWWDDVNDALNVRTALTVTVSANVPQVDPFQVFSEGLQATVGDLQAEGGSIQWYLEPMGGVPLDSNDLLENEHYYAQMGESPCRSQVEVFIGTPLPEGDGYQLVCEGATLEDLNGVFELEEGATIVWYAVEEGGTSLSFSTLLVNGETYYAVQVDAYGFESEERKSVIVNLSSVFPPFVLNTEQTFYVNQPHTIANLLAIGHEIRWYDQETGGTIYAESEELENGQIYYAEQTLNGCKSMRQGVLVRILDEEAPTLFGCEKFKPKTGDRYVINAWVREQGVNPINPDTRPFNGSEESELFVDLLNHLKERVLSSESDIYNIPNDEYIPYSATENFDFNALLAYVKDTEIDERKLIIYDFEVEKDNYGRVIGFSFALNRSRTSTFTYKSPRVRKNTGGIAILDYRYPIRDNFDNLTLEFKDVKVENGQFKIISDFSMQNAGAYSTTLTNIADSDSGNSGIHSEVTFYDYEEISNYQPITYANAMMEIVYQDENEQTMQSESLQFVPKGSVIEGWQQVSGSFIIPIDAYQMTLSLKNTASDINVYFDDLRFHPYDSNMKTFVYDPITQRLMSELDENNYATFYEYDEEGGLVRVKKETERGVFTIQETRSGNAKSAN